MPATIPDVPVDSTKRVFSVGDTPYGFRNESHVFSGENTFLGTGHCFLVAKFNSIGELQYGTVKVAAGMGGIPSLAIPSQTLLLLGSIVNVDTSHAPGRFQANFIFRIDHDYPGLGYTSHFGIWKAYMVIPGWLPTDVRNLFRRSWGPNGAPLSSYIGQVANIV